MCSDVRENERMYTPRGMIVYTTWYDSIEHVV